MLPARQTTAFGRGPIVAITATRRAHLFIEEWLRFAGLSDQDAAEKLGIERESVFRWRTEQRRLNPQKIQQLADLVGCKPGQLWAMPPANDSVDAILEDADPAIRSAAVDIVKRLVQKPSTT